MSRPSPRAALLPPGRAGLRSDGPIRLDRLANPYGPSLHVFEALAAGEGLHYPAGEAEERLRGRIATLVGVPPEWLVLANGLDEVLGMTLLWRRQRGPVLLFPPHDPADAARCARYGVPTVGFQRAPSFALELDPDAAADLPPEAMALVTSPNDPTGNLLGAQEAVRLSRACDLVVVDERHGASSGRSLVPLVREFENLIVVQTFETWAGLAGFPVAYAVAPPKLARELAVYRRNEGVAMGAVVAAEATLDDLQRVRATAHWVRQERSRLFRTLRKLNLVRPFPSWAGFLLARVERGDRDALVAALARRRIAVHAPPQPELAAFLRIAAGRPEHTDALKQALIEIAATV